MFDYVNRELERIENSIGNTATRSEIYKSLRSLGLSDFGELMLLIPNPQFPKLSNLLPRMASNEIQMSWTGNSGQTLLTQSLDFVRSLAYNYTKATGNSLEQSTILDFGCGYGRIARLMYYFTDEDNYYGVDPWDKSIEICNNDGLTNNFLLSEYLPTELPVKAKLFDLIFAFSVFTHLSERATLTCLNTLEKYLKPDGLIAITIRPVEYWYIDVHAKRKNVEEQQIALHHKNGFSFLPHNRDKVDGDITYGDSSMTLDWLAKNFPNLNVVGIDRSLNDQFQIYVFLQKI